MKVRFVPETIYHCFWDRLQYPKFIEREMDFLPPMDIEINDVTSEWGDPFFALLNSYPFENICTMAAINGFRDYGWRENWVEIKNMTKDDFMDELWDRAIGYNWRIKRMFYDLNENAYYCIVELNKGKNEN